MGSKFGLRAETAVKHVCTTVGNEQTAQLQSREGEGGNADFVAQVFAGMYTTALVNSSTTGLVAE